MVEISFGSQALTHLRKMMLDELQRRNYAQNTTRSYIRTVEDFARRFNRPPDRLGPRHVREYQAELFLKRKLSPGSLAVRLAARRFFYGKTLKKGWSFADTPYPKKNHRLPAILSQQEVARLIQAVRTPFHRTLLMTLYATGLRCAQLTRLKISDIEKPAYGDSRSRRQGKQRPGCDAQCQVARRTPWALAPSTAKTQDLAFPRQ
jgi:site-specific recombinase XerD